MNANKSVFDLIKIKTKFSESSRIKKLFLFVCLINQKEFRMILKSRVRLSQSVAI